MECDCNLHHFLHDEITVIDSSFDCLKGSSRTYADKHRSQLYSIIDKIGSLSAKAQSLPGAITTGMKLMYSDHRLYVLKDRTPDSRQVIGILKVGPKKLFIYDMHGVQHELEPLCVLDFYVHESRQRQGCGRKLFDYMLHREGVIPRHLAIDRPSHKFSAFLEKHYLLNNVIPQMNNFVVFQGFFRDRTDYPRGRRHRSAVNGTSFGGNNRPPAASAHQHTNRRQSPTLPRLPSAHNRRPSSSSRPTMQQPVQASSRPPVQPPVQASSRPPVQPPVQASSRPIQPPVQPQAVPEFASAMNLTSNLKSISLLDDPQTGGLGVERRGDIGDHQSHREDPPVSSPPRRTTLKQESAFPINGHHDYLTRDGRLKTDMSNSNNSRRDAQSAHFGSLGNVNGGSFAQNNDANWTMYSAAKPNNYTYEVGLNRNYKHTRLW